MLNCRYIRTATLLLLNLLVLTACQTLPINGKLPDNLSARKIAVVDKNTPFAVSPDGNVVALVCSGLKLLHITTKVQLPLTAKNPRKIVWSPSGNTLAALFSEEQKSRITTYDQYGSAVAETVIDARLTDLGWLSENELALGGTVIKAYTFGSNYRSILCRWKPGIALPVISDLRDSTLRPSTIRRWQTFLEHGPRMDFSSQTPLISYLHPVDPPVFTPYYKLIIKDLASGKEIEIAALSLYSDGAKLSADGEKILFGDGTGSTVLRNPWSEAVLFNSNSPGFKPALSPDTGSWFADGNLYRNDTLLTRLAPEAMAQFTADGRHLVLEAGKDLYLLSGLRPAEGTQLVPSLNDKIQKLRSLKVEGLISPKDYKEALERITQP